LDEVAYVTSPGSRVRTVVSDLGVLEKAEDGELVLVAYFPLPGQPEAEVIRAIKDQCGWELKVGPDPEAIEPPAPAELNLLRILDPRRQFLGKR